MEQLGRAPYENVCGSLARVNSGHSKQAPPVIVDRRQNAATGFHDAAPAQWDWRSVIRPLPTSTMDHVAIATDTQRECVCGSQNVIVLVHTDQDTPGGQQCEGIDKKTKDTHRKHKKETQIKKKAKEHSPKTEPLLSVVVTEQTPRDQPMSDRSMPPPQPLSESWMSEQRTVGDPRTQPDTAIRDPPRSGDVHAKKHKHSKHHGGHQQKCDMTEIRSGYVSNVTENGWMDGWMVDTSLKTQRQLDVS